MDLVIAMTIPDNSSVGLLLLLPLLDSNLSFFGLLYQFLLVLLLAQSVQEFVRLGQDLWYQSVFIEVLDIEDLA